MEAMQLIYNITYGSYAVFGHLIVRWTSTNITQIFIFVKGWCGNLAVSNDL